MADEQSNASVIVDIDTTSASQQLANLNASIRTLNGLQRELKKEIAAGNDEFGRNSQLVAENDKALKLLQAQAKSLTGQIQNETTANEGLGDSFVELDAYCRQLEKQYKAMSAAQRESAAGQELKAQIIEQKQALKDFDAELLNHQRNVGNYPQLMGGAFGKVEGILGKFGTSLQGLASGGFGSLKTAVSGAGKTLVSLGKTILTTPVGWIAAALAALVAIFNKVREAIAKNDDASTALARLWASFDPILKMLNKGFEKVANAIGWVANKIADLLAKFSDEVKAAQDVVTATDAMEDKEREYGEAVAENEAKVSELKAKAAERDKYTVEERIKFMEEAIEAERDTLSKQKELATDRYNLLLEEQKKNADTSDEMKNRLSQARIEMIKADQSYNDGVRRLNSSLANFRAEETRENQKAANEAKKADNEKAESAEEAAARIKRAAENQSTIEYELAKYTNSLIKDERSRRLADLVLDHKKELEELQKKYEDEASLTEEGRKKLNELMESKEQEYLAERQRIVDEAVAESMSKQEEAELSEIDRTEMDYENRILALQNFLDTTEDLTLEQRQELNDQIVALEQEKDDKVAELEKKAAKERAKAIASEVASTADMLGGLYDSLGKLAKAFTDDEKEQAKIEKAMAIGKALVASGVAIAQGTAQAMSVPFPANLAAIVTTVATVAANIATAVSTIKQAKFAEGGIVPGTSYTGDLVQARLNSGEMVLNKRQQAQLFEIANTGTASNVVAMTEAFTAAVSALPNPVLQYEEFETFQDGVSETRKVATI